MTKRTDAYMFLVKRILRYLKGTMECITYSSSFGTHIPAYLDVDYASNINKSRLVTGYVVFLGSNPIS